LRPLSCFIATSEDGYIAPSSGDLSFLDRAHLEGEDYGYQAFKSRVDTVFMGRKTYEKVAALGHPDPHPDCKMLVFSAQSAPATWVEDERRLWCNEPVADWARGAKNQKGQGLYCDGGAQLLAALLQARLVDELIVTVVPIPLGEGLPLWDTPERMLEFACTDERSYPNGVIQKTYRLKPSE
jgi:dihydrofolate reductase